MILNNTYKIQNKHLKEILNEVDTIINNIDTFRNKHEGYSYDVKLINNNNLWDAEITIKHEKRIDNRVLEKVS